MRLQNTNENEFHGLGNLVISLELFKRILYKLCSKLNQFLGEISYKNWQKLGIKETVFLLIIPPHFATKRCYDSLLFPITVLQVLFLKCFQNHLTSYVFHHQRPDLKHVTPSHGVVFLNTSSCELYTFSFYVTKRLKWASNSQNHNSKVQAKNRN